VASARGERAALIELCVPPAVKAFGIIEPAPALQTRIRDLGCGIIPRAQAS
jgi:hypothetical protein